MSPNAAASEDRFVPAAGREGVTRFYDAALSVTMRERLWRPWLVTRCASLLPDGGRLIDVGSGTGTFAIRMAASRPDVTVVGVDGDREALALAQSKPGAGSIDWRRGLVGDLGLAPRSADVVVISLLLHHLKRDGKLTCLREARDTLKPGGALLIADWGPPRGLLTRVGFGALRLLDGRENTADHAAGRLPELISEVGFRQVRPERRLATAWGELEIHVAERADG